MPVTGNSLTFIDAGFLDQNLKLSTSDTFTELSDMKIITRKNSKDLCKSKLMNYFL